MKVYVDLVFLLNLIFDFLILLTTSVVLHRRTSYKRLLLGALVGATSIFFLFLKLSTLMLFLLKVVISIGMLIATFGYHNWKQFMREFSYLYMVSIVMGGFLYFLNVQFSYQQEGLVFYHRGFSINVIFLFIFSPIILYTYVKQGKKREELYDQIHLVQFRYRGKTYAWNGFVDTGNHLKDPYFHRPVILVEKDKIDVGGGKKIYIPYDTANHHAMLECIPITSVTVDGILKKRKILVGLLEDKIHLDGVDCILQTSIWEG